MRIFFTLLCFFAVSATSAQDRYVNYMIGATLTEDSTLSIHLAEIQGSIKAEVDNTINVSMGIGKYVGNNFRREFELSIRQADLEGIEARLKTISVFYKVHYELGELYNNKLKPYLTLGIGGFYHEGKLLDTYTSHDLVHGGVAGFGLIFDKKNGTSYILEYNYLRSVDMQLDFLEASYAAHEIRFGGLFDF